MNGCPGRERVRGGCTGGCVCHHGVSPRAGPHLHGGQCWSPARTGTLWPRTYPVPGHLPVPPPSHVPRFHLARPRCILKWKPYADPPAPAASLPPPWCRSSCPSATPRSGPHAGSGHGLHACVSVDAGGGLHHTHPPGAISGGAGRRSRRRRRRRRRRRSGCGRNRSPWISYYTVAAHTCTDRHTIICCVFLCVVRFNTQFARAHTHTPLTGIWLQLEQQRHHTAAARAGGLLLRLPHRVTYGAAVMAWRSRRDGGDAGDKGPRGERASQLAGETHEQEVQKREMEQHEWEVEEHAGTLASRNASGSGSGRHVPPLAAVFGAVARRRGWRRDGEKRRASTHWLRTCSCCRWTFAQRVFVLSMSRANTYKQLRCGWDRVLK